MLSCFRGGGERRKGTKYRKANVSSLGRLRCPPLTPALPRSPPLSPALPRSQRTLPAHPSVPSFFHPVAFSLKDRHLAWAAIPALSLLSIALSRH